MEQLISYHGKTYKVVSIAEFSDELKISAVPVRRHNDEFKGHLQQRIANLEQEVTRLKRVLDSI